MKTIYYMVMRSFVPIFLISLTFFVLVLELVDLFANLWRYLNQDVPLAEIVMIQLLYIPKCISFAIPISVLFSTAFCLGDFYGKNELIAIFGAGISLYRFIVPLLITGAILSLSGFYFEENYVIDSFRMKNERVRNVLNQNMTFSNSNVTILGSDVRVVYHADYYNDQSGTLSGLIVVKRGPDGRFIQRIDAETAAWKDGKWVLSRVRVFSLDKGEIIEESHASLTDPKLTTEPSGFRKVAGNVDEMKRGEAKEWILTLRRAGLAYRGALTEYYKRFSFSLAPFVVSLLSGAVGGRFRKNILLMSLLMSLIFSVIYYVAQMVMILFAKLGYIAPLAGAWAAFFIFLVFGLFLLRSART